MHFRIQQGRSYRSPCRCPHGTRRKKALEGLVCKGPHWHNQACHWRRQCGCSADNTGTAFCTPTFSPQNRSAQGLCAISAAATARLSTVYVFNAVVCQRVSSGFPQTRGVKYPPASPATDHVGTGDHIRRHREHRYPPARHRRRHHPRHQPRCRV